MKVDNFFKFPVASSAATASPLLTDLQAYWKLDEASGNRADSKGTNTLSPTNAPGNAAGRITNAVDLTTASSQYLSIASNSTIVTGNIDWTIQVWVYLKSKAAAQLLIGKGNAVSFANIEYELFYSLSSDRFLFRVSDGTTYHTIIDAVLGSPSINTWYHLLFGHDATSSSLFLKINDGTANTLSMGASNPNSSTAELRIGARGNSSDFADSRICEAAYWKRLLTAGEATQLYNSGAGLAYPFA